jgi:hypothetical protein
MKVAWLAIGAGALLSALLSMTASRMTATEPEWGPSRVKDCNRECLVGFMDGYLDAIYKHDPKAVPPLSIDVRMTENTGRMDVGEGVLWRSKVEPTSFKILVADPVTGQVAFQGRLMIQGRSALVAVRLKVDRGHISEIEQLYDRNINDAAIPLLTTPRPGLVTDIPASSKARAKRWLTRQIPISMRWKATTARSPRSPTIACATRMVIRPSIIPRPADA